MEGGELVPISALQHYSFCPRQCGLIHLEQCFRENELTIRGHAVHERIDKADGFLRAELRIEYSLPLFSRELGVFGQADVVEFLPDGTPFPVEFKHGKRAERLPDDIQVAAQAICLEEMTGKSVPEGAIFHFSSRRRRLVEITDQLREVTKATIIDTRAMLLSMKLPAPVNDQRCRNCSLLEICQPRIITEGDKRERLRNRLYSSE